MNYHTELLHKYHDIVQWTITLNCFINIMILYVIVIARCWVQYEKYFPSSFRFRDIARAEGECNITETKRTRKIFPYCTNMPCDNYFITRCENIVHNFVNFSAQKFGMGSIFVGQKHENSKMRRKFGPTKVCSRKNSVRQKILSGEISFIKIAKKLGQVLRKFASW